MKEEQKLLTVYIADDGTEFTDRKNCEAYELQCSKIRYFCVHHTPDLTQTGDFTRRTYYMVFSWFGCWQDILDEYLRSELKMKKIGPSVMGYGLQVNYIIEKLEGMNKDNITELISTNRPLKILSPIELNMSPKSSDNIQYINYMKIWNLK
jgi:hypothetical protein